MNVFPKRNTARTKGCIFQHMNLLHMKYAVEIAEAKSINRASETLFVGQPTLSRAIKELEQNLGIKIFDRSAKGMFLTPDGEVFIRYAKAILKQVDEVEAAFRRSDAFTAFSLLFKPSDAIDAFYYETNSANTVKNVLQEDYRLGIVRYAAEYDKYYKDMLEEKNLAYELVAEFRYVLVAGRNSSLARAGSVKFNMLKDYIEIAHADPYVPSMPFNAACCVKKRGTARQLKSTYFCLRARQSIRTVEQKQRLLHVGLPDSPRNLG